MVFTELGRAGFDPFLELRRMQEEMNRGLEGWARPGTAAVSYPPVNLWVGEDSVVVTAETPGIGRDDLDLTVREDTLTIHARRPQPGEGEEVAWHRRERVYGEFARTVELPFRVDPDRVEARFSNGVLEVELRRPKADQPRKIKVKGS